MLLSFALVAASCSAPLAASSNVALLESLRPRVDAHITFLASDEMAGRDTGSPQDGITAQYVASVFRTLGLRPMGDDGGYLAHYPLLRTHLDLDATLFEPEGVAHEPFVAADDYAVRGYGAEGFDLSAPVVFAGYGIETDDGGYDDYAGLDTEDRFVLTLSGAPADREDLRAAANWRTKSEVARRHGALGEIVVIADDDRSFRWTAGGMRGGSMVLGGDAVEAAETPFPRYVVKTKVASALLGAAGEDLAALKAAYESGARSGGFEIPGVTLHARAAVVAEQLTSANVLGVLPGSDPVLSHEYVIVSAHMDHVGTNAEGDVYNGADDNASGTTALMTVAELMSHEERPRRSILFMTVSGEEKGLLGSEWWTKHPTVELKDVVADINTDMVGRNDGHSIGITPSADHPDYNTMVQQAVELGPLVGLDVGWFSGEGDYRRKVDEYYTRSDHVNFSRAGIPVVFFFAGEHADYHQPTDTVDKIDRDKILRVVDLVSRLATEVADSDERPHKLAP